MTLPGWKFWSLPDHDGVHLDSCIRDVCTEAWVSVGASKEVRFVGIPQLFVEVVDETHFD